VTRSEQIQQWTEVFEFATSVADEWKYHPIPKALCERAQKIAKDAADRIVELETEQLHDKNNGLLPQLEIDNR